ncbi:hypothetical protein [Rubrivirga sp.]|uniref:hypothetical protein n=1 Tax=Rubrivirga sp. TaxID=1885344 RepID=UPI003C709824
MVLLYILAALILLWFLVGVATCISVSVKEAERDGRPRGRAALRGALKAFAHMA